MRSVMAAERSCLRSLEPRKLVSAGKCGRDSTKVLAHPSIKLGRISLATCARILLPGVSLRIASTYNYLQREALSR